jgi:uncharacterized membrane protein YkoI
MLTFSQVRKIVAEHLKTALSVDKFDITSAKLDEVQDVWRISVEFKKPENPTFTDIASLTIDATTGEIKEFKRGV